jgi:hypothetical protein
MRITQILLTVVFLYPALACSRIEIEDETLGTYRLGAEFAAGRYIAIDENYGGVTFFAVPGPSINSIHFLLDAKAFKLEKKDWAASAGIGFRKVDMFREKVFGINMYYDYLDQNSANYHQWGVGFEMFSRHWEFHLNGYLPVSNKRALLSQHEQQFEDNFFAIFRTRQYALRGVEISGGYWWDFYDDLFLYVGPGFYFYNNSKLGTNIQGIEGTVEFNWNDWLTFRVNGSYDSKFKGRVQGVFALTIPLSFENSCNCKCCESVVLGRPVRRNDLIFLRRCCSVDRNFDDCGLPN